MIIKPTLDISEIVSRLYTHEGCVLAPYICPTGHLTIGIGHNIDSNPFTKEEAEMLGDWKNGISREAAFTLCKNDIARCVDTLRKKILFYDNLDCERQYALIDLCFNMGIANLLKFKRMLSALASGYYDKASDELLNSKYADQVGKRAKRIAKLIKTGKWEEWVL